LEAAEIPLQSLFIRVTEVFYAERHPDQGDEPGLRWGVETRFGDQYSPLFFR
jgi:hypothetical protein